MEEVASYVLAEQIAKDFNLETTYIDKRYFNQFLTKNGKKQINATNTSIIVDKDGNEHPYMISQYVRNDAKLIEFDHIYQVVRKSITQLIKESGVEVKREKCKISEGGGWYSEGQRITYKDMYCEI